MSAPLALMPRPGTLFLKFTAVAVLVAFVMQITQPVVLAFQPGTPSGQDRQVRKPDHNEQLAKLLRETGDTLQAAESGLRRGLAVAHERRALADLRRQLAGLDREVLAEFDAVEAMLRERGVPEVILERHRETVTAYRQEFGAFNEELAAVEEPGITAEELRARVVRAGRRLGGHQLERSPRPFDPAVLPHGPRLPAPDNHPRERGEDFPVSGLYNTPPLRLAALEGFLFDTLPGADDPAYLAESVEVRLSPAILAKAAELEHQPVAIYHWVRNHVEWLPSWGAVQDADVTLTSRRGNAMDIAGLLVSLLRASGVPARYVHGAVEVPEDRFRNWAGGFEQIEEAMNYASSGGIPLTGLVAGGKVSHVRMEHVWVEAAVDFLPSRAAVMRQADTWLALDATFKQYEYLEGLDLAAITAIDGEALVQQFIDSGTVNEEQGWVQGLDPTVVEAAQEQARQALEAHIETMTDPTVGEVVGGGKVILQEEAVLPSGLPYQRVVEGARYAYLPQALQPRITFGMGADLFGDPQVQESFPWAQLNNRKVTLSFRPATEADEEALLALLPEGEITDLSQLPTSIPAYLIQVIPELS
ncbi:transglutaminase domain-containing protein, partial [Desulfurivibrio sp. D14AmB]|uniref:transglutaminase domain-containing protein n=1 Tax=Desulfurivibrio sp. D14AmB TaxID=3374370 RepID=UPI00376EF768